MSIRNRLTNRARLTLVAASISGLLFLIIFALSVKGLHDTEITAASRTLGAALAQLEVDITAGEGRPDLEEVVGANPEISLAVYDAQGALVANKGGMLPPFNAAEGLLSVGKDSAYIQSKVVRGQRLVAALNWKSNEAAVSKFIGLASILFILFVAFVAAATWMAATATFRPLQQLAREAEALSGRDLSARMQIADSGEYRDYVLCLNRFLDRLESSVVREEMFLADAAHELRTPLTVFRGELETTLARERTTEEYRESLTSLLTETRRLSSLVELLLRSATPIVETVEPIDLAAAAERAHARWVDRFTENGIALTLETAPCQAAVSPAEFDVIVDNFLSNSLRASGRGTNCRIVVESEAGQVSVSVYDQGEGIDPAELERVLERAERPLKSQGFGIGLMLCKRIAERRSGHISARRNIPAGSVFTATLPQA